MAMAAMFTGCGDDPKPSQKPTTPPPSKPEVKAPPRLKTPPFDADTAYHFVQKQVDFGPRVPNTEAHLACADFLAKQLETYGLEVTVQKGVVKAYNGEGLNIRNIIGRYRPEVKERIMLFAHWDTRPYADRDTKRQAFPIDGANDGASGVAVLLEIARQLQADTVGPRIGVDIMFFDAEDYGQPQGTMTGYQPATWCLGSQHWARKPTIPNYSPRYGILLDMVGAKGAVFPKEGTSMRYAPKQMEKVWKIAHELGYANLFDNRVTGEITDDHLVINQIMGIPSIDIIHYDPIHSDFGPFHHRHTDNMEIVDAEIMKVVGHVVLEVIYREY